MHIVPYCYDKLDLNPSRASRLSWSQKALKTTYFIRHDAHRHAVVVVRGAGGQTGGGDIPIEGDGLTQPQDAEVVVGSRALAVLGVDSGAANLDRVEHKAH